MKAGDEMNEEEEREEPEDYLLDEETVVEEEKKDEEESDKQEEEAEQNVVVEEEQNKQKEAEEEAEVEILKENVVGEQRSTRRKLRRGRKVSNLIGTPHTQEGSEGQEGTDDKNLSEENPQEKEDRDAVDRHAARTLIRNKRIEQLEERPAQKKTKRAAKEVARKDPGEGPIAVPYESAKSERNKGKEVVEEYYYPLSVVKIDDKLLKKMEKFKDMKMQVDSPEERK